KWRTLDGSRSTIEALSQEAAISGTLNIVRRSVSRVLTEHYWRSGVQLSQSESWTEEHDGAQPFRPHFDNGMGIAHCVFPACLLRLRISRKKVKAPFARLSKPSLL